MSRAKRVMRWVAWACYGYPISLLAIALVVRFGAEHNFLLAVAQYLPPQGYLVPLLLVLPLWALRGPRLAYLSLAGGLLLAGAGLMGGRLHLSILAGDEGRVVVTANVDSAFQGVEQVAETLLSHHPDLLLLQEVGVRGEELARALRPALAHTLVHGQFVIASRYPIEDLVVPEAVFVRGRERIARFIRVRVDFPERSVAVYNVHPISPRPAFIAVRGKGFRSEILSGHLFDAYARDAISKNVEVRQFELKTVAQYARRERLPILIAGDLNLPTNSRFLAETFSGFVDVFDRAGNGFGFTYPAKMPFLRLDRILVSPTFTPQWVDKDCEGVSDHLCLVTKLDFSPR